jgi:hypothetical protein
VTSSAEMKVKTPPTKLLDRKIWNPRPEVYLAPRAVSDESKFKIIYLAGVSKNFWTFLGSISACPLACPLLYTP